MENLKHGFNINRDFFLGDSTGKMKLVWYIDYNNRHSRQIRDIVLRTADRVGIEYGALAFRFTPESGNESSQIAARAAIAAGLQGHFTEMHKALFSEGTSYTETLVLDIAKKLGLDITTFRKDLHSEAVSERIKEDQNWLRETGLTICIPMLFINNAPYRGAWDEQSLLEALEKPLGFRLKLATTEFIDWAASAGFMLILATLAALIYVNIGYHEQYEHLRSTVLAISWGSGTLSLSLEQWINDGLMAIFFLLVGIEIKREIVSGELSDLSSAALPIVAALGGMITPALIYALININSPDTIHGWGTPMATDIAFTLGIMAILGSRVPLSLKVFLSALAIADDLGSILVIALFYSHGFAMDAFISAGIVMIIMAVLNISKIYNRTPYVILGVVLWYFVHESGLHATLAGVLTAMAIPSRPAGNIKGLVAQASAVVDFEMRRQEHTENATLSSNAIRILKDAQERLYEPGYHLQKSIENWSNYLILPLFAFFNTGIVIVGASFNPLLPEISGVMLGLIVGKPLGITLSCYLAVRFGIAKLSQELSWTHIIGAGCLAGIGFTMSLFIASSAFEGDTLDSVKLAILIASCLSATIGTTILVKTKHTID